MENNISNNLNVPSSGMVMGKFSSDLEKGQYSLLVNGNVESINGNWMKITNEPSNLLCSKLKDFKLIGSYVVPSLSLTFVALVNTTTKESEIGFINDSFRTSYNDREIVTCSTCNPSTDEGIPLEDIVQEEMCSYYTVVNANCLNFSIDHPVKIWVKVDDCNIRIYFTDGLNPLRYIDYPDFQKETIINCPKITNNELDCDKIKIFKNVCYPHISYIDVVSGGENTAGVYQFAMGYADAYGNFITSIFYVSNPISLWDKSKTILQDQNVAYPIAKSIKINISNINKDFDWFNIVVLKTVNNTTTPYLVGTFSNIGSSFDYVFAGIDANLKQNLSLQDVLVTKPVYQKAEIIAESNGILFFADLSESRPLNLQPVINKLKLKWQTVELTEGDYQNPILAEKYTGLLRDEVYPYAIEFFRTNTNKTARFHIPGREATPTDLEDVSLIPCATPSGCPNPDVFVDGLCSDETRKLRWEVYNTGINKGYACGYSPTAGGEAMITKNFSCSSDVTFYTYDSSDPNNPAPGVYYKNWNEATNELSDPFLTDPCIEFPCPTHPTGTCYKSLVGIYGEAAVDGSTFINCVVSSPTCLGKIKRNTYTIPDTTPPAPVAPKAPDPLPDPCNNNCINSNCVSIADLSNCDIVSGSPSNPYLVKIIPADSTWYKVTASSDVVQFKITSTYNITDGRSFTVSIYSTVSGFCSDIVLVDQQVSSNPYFLFTGLTNGATYYISVSYDGAAVYPTPSGGSPAQNNFYYICMSTPAPTGEEEVYLPCSYKLSCNYSLTYSAGSLGVCNAQTYEEGEMAYWESSEKYPCNVEVWGDLADKPIRHHKFPDCKISSHFKNPNPTTIPVDIFKVKNRIYPIGVRLDAEDVKIALYQAVADGLITDEERLSICGYRILRGNRRGNESIVAKGLLYDVWRYTDNVYKGADVLYPNYPYNPRTPDVFNVTSKIVSENDLIGSSIQHPYTNNSFWNNKYTFHSPNTHFNNPGLGSEVRLELEYTGISEGRFNEVVDHAKYQYTGIGMLQAALGFSCAESFIESVELVSRANGTAVSVLGSTAYISWILAIVSVNIGALGFLMQHYYEWLDILKKFAPYTNYAWMFTSIGNYVDYNTTNINDQVTGNRRRGLNDAQYLNSGILTVSDGLEKTKINNYKRESSVYLNLNVIDNNDLDLGSNFLNTSIADTSRWVPSVSDNCNIGYKYNTISSYYASLKNNLFSQYGQIDNIDYIDTGYNGTIDWENNQDTSCDTVFGGDTFINRFGLRTQFPFFLQDRVGYAPNSDVQYGELGNVGFPKYFMNYPTSADIGGGGTSLFGEVAIQGLNRVDYNMACPDYTGDALFRAGIGVGIASAIAAGTSLSVTLGFIYGVAKIAVEKTTKGHDVFITGKIFLYAYGQPEFICESNYNTDLRYGINQKEGNFYPNVGDMISWTQPTKEYNLINFDNSYYYNKDYSKANKENLGYTLNPNFEQTKEDCKAEHSNRVIYSLQDNDNNDRFDGNLVYLANNYHDFSKAGGKLSIIKGIENNKVLVIQENQASVFNAYSTLEADVKNVAVGSGSLFNNNLQLYVKTDLGYGGSQTPAITSTEFGHFWVDNKRGQIFHLDNQISDITIGENQWWFKESLPFRILQDFPEVNVKNNFKYFGMAITFDSRMKRIIFTKRDAKLLPEYKGKVVSNTDGTFTVKTFWNIVVNSANIGFPVGNFFTNKGVSGKIISVGTYSAIQFGYPMLVEVDADIELNSFINVVDNNGVVIRTEQIKKVDNSGIIVEPTDSKYFCNQSWTISYSPLFKGFVSFLSYTPNSYIANQNYFQSIVNYPTSTEKLGVWNHLLTNQSYQVFYGVKQPFLFEYSLPTEYSNKILNSLQWKADFNRFTSEYDFYKTNVTYNEALIYSQKSTSGNLTLIPKQKNNLNQTIVYQNKIVDGKKQILCENVEDFYRINNFFNIYQGNNQPVMQYNCSLPYKELNTKSISNKTVFFNNPLRNDFFNIRLSNTLHSQYQIVNLFQLAETTKSET
tara:strand:+ start:30346 stop:36363 length:6018 start_codon:yes stop_codon:yes gene_type:complete